MAVEKRPVAGAMEIPHLELHRFAQVSLDALISRLVIIASTRNRWTRMGKTLRQLPGVTTGFELDGARPGEPV
ncbi:Uncharacterised protein [Mycobacteroides abscessus subsp. abscessus]|nr:Uncharacterised protein [Mycobacteroides abscessus subsp. abscessus]